MNRHYALLALDAVRAAAQVNVFLLRRRVSDDVEIDVWNGDSGSGGRGPLGLIRLVQVARLRGYRFSVANPGPISVLPPSTCEYETRIAFITASPGEIVELRFRFVQGRLTRIEGNYGRMEEGALEPAVTERTIIRGD